MYTDTNLPTEEDERSIQADFVALKATHCRFRPLVDPIIFRTLCVDVDKVDGNLAPLSAIVFSDVVRGHVKNLVLRAPDMHRRLMNRSA